MALRTALCSVRRALLTPSCSTALLQQSQQVVWILTYIYRAQPGSRGS